MKARFDEIMKKNYDNHMMIGSRIKESRKAMRYKQKDVAKKLQLSQNYLSDIERDIYEPSIRLIKAYCLTFNVNEDWLTNGKGEMFIKNATNQETSKLSELERLAELKTRDLISDSEFQLLKDELLAPLKANKAPAA